MLIDLLSHLSIEDKNRIDFLEKEIQAMQGKLQSNEDTLKLSKLYSEISKIIKGEST